MHHLIFAAVLAASADTAVAQVEKVTPNEVLGQSQPGEWVAIDARDLLVIDIDDKRRVVIQLAPRFAPVHVENIRNFARTGYWAGSTIYRVQDNYVTQWGAGDSERPLPDGVIAQPPAEYHRALDGLKIVALGSPDPYAPMAGYSGGWPVAYDPEGGTANLTHCYGSVGVSRGLSPDTGTGSDLYAAIGHAPRHLDRNITVVGRVVSGIEHLSSLKRGTGPLGFIEDANEHTPIASVRLASMIEENERPAFEYLKEDSASFTRWLKVKKNRRDDFYIRPAGGVALCNAPVPVRPVGG